MIQRKTAATARVDPGIPAGPVRTCIGCRGRELAAGLLRVVAGSPRDGAPTVAVDTAGTLPGRGAWLHPDPQCLHAAIRRRAFARALRIAGSPDTSAVVGHFTEAAPDAAIRTGSEKT